MAKFEHLSFLFVIVTLVMLSSFRVPIKPMIATINKGLAATNPVSKIRRANNNGKKNTLDKSYVLGQKLCSGKNQWKVFVFIAESEFLHLFHVSWWVLLFLEKRSQVLYYGAS